MADDIAHCTICQKDVPRKEFLKHFRECSDKKKKLEAANAPPPKPPPKPTPAAPTTSGGYSAPDYNENLTAAMGMDASCLPEGYNPNFDGGDDGDGDWGGGYRGSSPAKPKRPKKRFEELYLGVDPNRLDYAGKRKYKIWKTKVDWMHRQRRDTQITETGLQYRDLDDAERFNLEACQFCKFYFQPERILQHERVCTQQPRPGPEDGYFDIAAPVAILEDWQRIKLKKRMNLESHERIMRLSDSHQRPWSPNPKISEVAPQARRGRTRADLKADRERPIAPAEFPTQPVPVRDIMDELPDNPNWLQTVPMTIGLVKDVVVLMDEVRVHPPEPPPPPPAPKGPRFSLEERRSRGMRERQRERESRSGPDVAPVDSDTLLQHAAIRRAQLEMTKPDGGAEGLGPDSELFVAGAAPEVGAPARTYTGVLASPELQEMEARRRAVLIGNAWGDCYYPYSDKFMLDSDVYHDAAQRKAVITGLQGAALYNARADRKETLQQVYDDIHWRQLRAAESKAATRKQIIAHAAQAQKGYGSMHYF